MKKLIAGNWKMNGLMASLDEVTMLKQLCTSAHFAVADAADIVICPPATLLGALKQAIQDTEISLGGQDCHMRPSGAHTGDVSAQMLEDAGARYVIVGHSERRADHAERNADIRAKAAAAQSAGLVPIICVGETEDERARGTATDVVTAQLNGSLPEDSPREDGSRVVAYEPVWAIGTGLVPTRDDIKDMHETIRNIVGARTPILYGGSVKPGNAAEILHTGNVDGALVGGASLKAQDFFAIIEAAAGIFQDGAGGPLN